MFSASKVICYIGSDTVFTQTSLIIGENGE